MNGLGPSVSSNRWLKGESEAQFKHVFKRDTERARRASEEFTSAMDFLQKEMRRYLASGDRADAEVANFYAKELDRLNDPNTAYSVIRRFKQGYYGNPVAKMPPAWS